jgi:hypothetical protein
MVQEQGQRMRLQRYLVWAAFSIACGAASAQSYQDHVIVRPAEIDDVLVNPGIGFTTFQRFNGDRLNEGTRWTEGYPIEYQPFAGLAMKDHPLTSIAYFRVYWKFVEPKNGEYDWELLDKAMRTARERGQSRCCASRPTARTRITTSRPGTVS